MFKESADPASTTRASFRTINLSASPGVLNARS